MSDLDNTTTVDLRGGPYHGIAQLPVHLPPWAEILVLGISDDVVAIYDQTDPERRRFRFVEFREMDYAEFLRITEQENLRRIAGQNVPVKFFEPKE